MEKKVYVLVKVVSDLLGIVQKMADDLEYQRIAKEVYTVQLEALQSTLDELRAS